MTYPKIYIASNNSNFTFLFLDIGICAFVKAAHYRPRLPEKKKMNIFAT